AIKLRSVGNGTTGDVLEFMVNGTGLQYSQNAYSASGPAADSSSPGEVTVGAIDPPMGTTIAVYSSQGPTNDGRIKPDVGAASCVRSFTYRASCFNGTSAATPVVAGAAALMLSAQAASTPSGVKQYLLSNAVDRGTSGTDSIYGTGEVVLPSPPDHTLPRVTAPVQMISTGAQLGTIAVPVKLTWTASDSGSGLSRSVVWQSTNGGAYVQADVVN